MTGVSAPRRLVLGSAQWGSQYGIANRHGPPDERELGRILDSAAHAGIRLIDTARGYGQSETMIGRVTAGSGRWEIVTKLAADVTGPGRTAEESLEAARASLQDSRHALQRDLLDVVLLHRAVHRTAHDGAIWRFLIEERDQGRIAQVGVSADSPEEALPLLDDPDVNAVQVATSLLDQRLFRAGFFTRAAERSTRVFVRSVFLQGVAHMRPEELPADLSELAPVLAEIRDWAAARGQAPAAPYLLFARALRASVVVGVERSDQLSEILGIWSEHELPVGELESLSDGVPELRREVLTPSLWQSRRSGPPRT